MKTLLTIISTLMLLQAVSQNFSNATSEGYVAVDRGDFSAADFDNNKTLDVISSGALNGAGLTKAASNLYLNTNGSFSLDIVPDLSLDSVFEASNLWGDFNNDGYLDLMISGWQNGPLSTSMYFNDGNGGFALNERMDFENLGYGDLAAGDLDNDGDIDFIHMGFASTGARRSLIYINNGDSTFNMLDNVLPGLDLGVVELADYDMDGDLDILINGATGSVVDNIDEAFTRLYENTDGGFSLKDEFEPIKDGEARWIDYNVDGLPDIILSGFNGVGGVTKLYTNNDGSFSESELEFDPHSEVAIGIGDINSDGYPDMIFSSSSAAISVYTNNQNDGFDKLDNHGLSGAFDYDIELADLDNDLDLDVMAMGLFASQIYRNDISTSNTKPSAPQNLQVVENDNSLTFTWDAGTDAETPTAALNYNYYLVYNSDTIVFADSHADGTRKIQNSGNAQAGMAIFNSKELGSYTIGVQTIDQTLNASGFAVLQFEVVPPPLSVDEDLNLGIYPNPVNNFLQVSWQDPAIRSLQVLSLDGKQTIVSLDVNNLRSVTLDLRKLKKGVYLLKTNTQLTRKVIVE